MFNQHYTLYTNERPQPSLIYITCATADACGAVGSFTARAKECTAPRANPAHLTTHMAIESGLICVCIRYRKPITRGWPHLPTRGMHRDVTQRSVTSEPSTEATWAPRHI